MAIVFEGQGTEFLFAGLTLAPKTIALGGWSKEVIDITNLNNKKVKTKLTALLKDIGDITLTCEYDPEVYADIPEDNQQISISFPTVVGALKFWGSVSTEGDTSMETDTQPTFDITITVTNLDDSGVETEPAWSSTP